MGHVGSLGSLVFTLSPCRAFAIHECLEQGGVGHRLGGKGQEGQMLSGQRRGLFNIGGWAGCSIALDEAGLTQIRKT